MRVNQQGLAVLVGTPELIDRIRFRIKKTRKVKGETSVVSDSVNDTICFDYVSYTTLPLPLLQHYHDELRRIEQRLRYPLHGSIDVSTLVAFRCRDLVIRLFRALESQTSFSQVLDVRLHRDRDPTIGVFLALSPTVVEHLSFHRAKSNELFELFHLHLELLIASSQHVIDMRTNQFHRTSVDESK